MTGNQLERFARAHRQVSHADDAAARVRRRLAWRFEDDGSLAGHVPAAAAAGRGAAARRCARRPADLDHPHHRDGDGGDGSVPAETAGGDGLPAGTAGEASRGVQTSSSLADALLVIAEAFLGGKIAAADDPEVYQVIVHVGTDALAQNDPAIETGSQQPAGVSAETPAPPGRCQAIRPTRPAATWTTAPPSTSAPPR